MGWSNETEHANRIMRLMIRRIQKLASKGACIIVENPLMSYLWKIDEVQGLTGSPGFSLTRIDHCTYGAPYKKGQIWASNCPKLSSAAGVCGHREPHPVRLEGGWARRSAPYPRELAMAVVQALIAELLETGRFSSKLSARAMQAHLLEESIRPAPERRSLGKQARSGDQRRIPVRGLWLIWARVGDVYIEHCKAVDFGFFGSLEVMSKTAAKILFENVEKCYGSELPWKTDQLATKYGWYGEDLFAQRCMDLHGVNKIWQFDLMTDGTCEMGRPWTKEKEKKWVPDPVSCSERDTFVGFKPLKSPKAHFACLSAVKGGKRYDV